MKQSELGIMNYELRIRNWEFRKLIRGNLSPC